MQSAPHATERVIGAMRELLTQSERVAVAEARVVASRVGDVAQAGVRRLALAVAAVVCGTLAIGFLLVAAYDVLATRMPGWAAALIVSASSCVVTMLLAWTASTAPSDVPSLLPTVTKRTQT